MRSPLAYPLNRAADTDVGGASDLQTDVMRFMAILSLCLVAIFALVQSMPLTPIKAAEPTTAEPPPTDQPVAELPVEEPVMVITKPSPKPAKDPEPDPDVVLTRPKWVPQYVPTPEPDEPVVAEVVQPVVVAESIPEPVAEPPPPVAEEPEGFTLRFESDAALTRLVAANQVGFYAIEQNRARRMTVSESRISFWDASTPNTFHEMEPTTVPAPVIDALARSGAGTDGVSWGVTLPGRLKGQLDTLMQEHRGGELVIEAGGSIRWEAG